jgi:hypothetical protein
LLLPALAFRRDLVLRSCRLHLGGFRHRFLLLRCFLRMG